MKGRRPGQIVIECPNTIFHLYVKDEFEMARIEVFMRNMQVVRRLGLTDIYNWCNRQGIDYDTQFHYRRGVSLWENIQSYMLYSRQKLKYQMV